MVFEGNTNKSSIQQVVEEVARTQILRFDGPGRRLRVKAAMVIEIAQNGYALAQIAAVAKRAEVSTATIYRDFGDRNALMLEAIEWVIRLFAQNWVTDCSFSNPEKRLEMLLLSHGEALNDPFMGWIFRFYVHLANTSVPHLLALGRVARDANLAFWIKEIASLEAHGHIVATDHKIVAALILGAIERRTIFSRMAFGENDNRSPTLADIAKHVALSLFQVFGTTSFWASRSDKPAPGWLKGSAADHGQSSKAPDLLLELPSQRLTVYAHRVMARDVHRLDAAARKVRIQLAAMIECITVGYESATMASVAQRAGVSTATFYNDYPDKRALFIDAIKLPSRFHVDYNAFIDASDPHKETLTSLIFTISSLLADVNFLWFHRVSMASEISDAPDLIQTARDTRTHTEAFWFDHFEGLESAGIIKANNRPLTLNLLLGPTQRRSVLSQVFFGAEDANTDELSVLARASTDFVMRLVGTKG